MSKANEVRLYNYKKIKSIFNQIFATRKRLKQYLQAF